MDIIGLCKNQKGSMTVHWTAPVYLLAFILFFYLMHNFLGIDMILSFLILCGIFLVLIVLEEILRNNIETIQDVLDDILDFIVSRLNQAKVNRMMKRMDIESLINALDDKDTYLEAAIALGSLKDQNLIAPLIQKGNSMGALVALEIIRHQPPTFDQVLENYYPSYQSICLAIGRKRLERLTKEYHKSRSA